MAEITPTISNVKFFRDEYGALFVAILVAATESAANTYTWGTIKLGAQSELAGLNTNAYELELLKAIEGVGTSQWPDMPTSLTDAISVVRTIYNGAPPTSSVNLGDERVLQVLTHFLMLDGVAATGGVLHAHQSAFPDDEDREAVVRNMRNNIFNSANPNMGISIVGSGNTNAKAALTLLVFAVHPLREVKIAGSPLPGVARR